LTGSLGTGKTILALTFALAGVRQKEPVLFLGFRETIEQLKQKMQEFPHEASLQRALAPGGRLTVQRWDPIELDPDQVATELLAGLNQTGAQRLVIDSIAELERAVVKSSGKERLPDFLAALLAAVRQAGVTLLAIKETSKAITTELDFSAEALEVLTENLLLMQQVVWQGHLHRLFMVLKTRFAPRDPALREVRITAPKGLEVLSPAESEPGLLSNFTHS
jgi:circadian clock protein KaiC